MGKGTVFTNDVGAAGGAIDYVKDVFDDLTISPTSNSGLTSTSSTNPIGGYYSDDDSTNYSVKTLYVKDLALIQDRSKWVQGKPTYSVIFNESFPQVSAYVFGNISISYEYGSSQLVTTIKNIGDGMGVTGRCRKVAFLVNDSTSATATGQISVDGSNTATIDFSSLATNSDTSNVARYSAFAHAASNETAGLHDYRLTALQVSTLNLVGLMVYFENSGANVQQNYGTTYVNKSKVTTLAGSTLALPAYGSSLGGKSVFYKTQNTGYTFSALSASTIASIAQGSSGTNLVNVSTGHGASFSTGYGVVIPQGTSMYVGMVTNVSTDTLTVSPTLSFGITNAIYTAWKAGQSFAINASLMQLYKSIDFNGLSGFSTPILDPLTRYSVWWANLGVTTVDSRQAALFLGASGFIQVDGYMSAAEVEFIGAGIHHATYSVNGIPAYSINSGQTGALKRVVFTDAGPGWNSFVIGCGASMGVTMGISKIDLYSRASDIGATYGRLAELETCQAYTERTAANATMMPLGLYRRYYADQLYLKGSWVRGVTYTVPGGVLYYGASTNSAMRFEYYGKNFSLIGTAASANITIDGVSTANTFNAFKTVASEGFHTVVYSHLGGTAQIAAIDVARSQDEIKSLQSFNRKKFDTLPPVSQVPVIARYYTGTSDSVSTSFATINYATKDVDTHNAVTTGSGWTFTAPKNALYRIYALVGITAASNTTGDSALRIRRNGVEVALKRINIPTGNIDILSLDVSDTLKLYAGDTIDAQVYSTLGSSRVLANVTSYNVISIQEETAIPFEVINV